MQIRCFDMRHSFCRNRLHAGICLVWIAGLALGFSADRFYGDLYCGLFEGAPYAQADFPGLAVVNLFPLLISALAVWINPFLLYFICLLRGALLGAGLCGCLQLYGQAGFLMACLVLFSLISYSPVLLWYWSAFKPDYRDFRRNTAICCCIAMIITITDLWIVTPFLQEVMTF